MISLVKKCSLPFIFALCLTSCSATRGVGEDIKLLHERPGIDVVLIPASYGGTYFTSKISGERHCKAPDPDVTVQSNAGLSLSDIAGDSIGFKDGEAAMSLGGRNPTLLITRELMYRACELTSNIYSDQEMTIAIYDRFLSAITEISKLNTKNGAPPSTNQLLAPSDSEVKQQLPGMERLLNSDEAKTPSFFSPNQ